MGQSITRAEMEDYKETVKGKFDEREIKHMHKLFFKAAPTGHMGPSEFKKYIDSLQIFKRVDPQEDYDQVFRGYDRDGDGTISFKEYLLYHLGIVFSTEELFDIVFAMYDVDGDNYITKEEMLQVITNSTRWMGDCDVEAVDVQLVMHQEVHRLFQFVDQSKEGRISKEDLRGVSLRHPEVLEKLKNLS
eukprot:Tbor_TRINITY_DN5825_c2_g5::TRINITY_DN5825_c2_g5_i1::g.6684::m.6684